MRIWVIVVGILLGAASNARLAVSSESGARMGEGPGQLAILGSNTYWRSFVTLGPQAVGRISRETKAPDGEPRTSPPPPDWVKPEFNDAAWLRRRQGINGDSYGFGGSAEIALICLRGRFNVTDPAQVKDLAFSGAFRGGVIVYLNGTEVVRTNMPAGEIAFDAVAEEYSFDAYCCEDGTSAIRSRGTDTVKYKDRCEMRVRRLDKARIPVGHLRKGVNVLAIEIHRAPQNPEEDKLKEASSARWAKAGIMRAELSASGGGIEPNTGTPKGLRVWNESIAASVPALGICADAVEEVQPVRIVAARNGVFSGQFVAGSDSAIKGLRCKASAMTLAGGTATIPESAMQIRYAGVDEKNRFDVLLDAPERDGKIQPVWITARVPSDAALGAYRGKVTVEAESFAGAEIPVELSVSGWKVPDTKTNATFVGMVESPETVAEYYKVALWSDAHFDLLERTMRLLGEVGCDTLYIPVRARHDFGKEGMVRLKGKDGGGWEHDFGIFDRYMDVVQKHMGNPEVICLYLWNGEGGSYFGDTARKRTPIPLSCIKSETNELQEVQGPLFGEAGSDEFWKPIFDGFHERLKKRGFRDESIMVGVAQDIRPVKEDTEFLKKIAPYARWVLHSHGNAGSINGVPVGYMAHVWGTHGVPAPEKDRKCGWMRKPCTVTVFPRTGACVTVRQYGPLGSIRAASEALFMSGYRGVGDLGADFWRIDKTQRKFGAGTMEGRYAAWGQLSMSEGSSAMLAPGRNGAVATVRFEMLREGMQEAEARAFIERAMQENKVKLEGSIAEYQKILDDRARDYRSVLRAWDWYPVFSWQEKSEQLFNTAAKVAAAIGQ